MKKTLSIVFAGGGSGGHVYPTIAAIEALRANCEGAGISLRMTRMGPDDGYATLFENQGVAVSPIVAGKVRQYASLQNILDIPKFFIGLIQALFKLFIVMPDVIFSKGGTGALPVVIAGWFYRIPIIIHESDAIPGRTNRASARFATSILVSFEAAAAYFSEKKTFFTGTPVRSELLVQRTTKELAKETLGFSSSQPLTLVIGGSQGAQRINEFILENLPAISKETQILHQTGIANLAEVQKLSRAAVIDESFRNRYQAIGYLTDNLITALTAADIIITRAGSNTIFEAASFGLPSILIPITASANDHQRANAYEFAETGAAVVIEEDNLLPGIFIGQLKNILTDKALYQKMSTAAQKFFKPDAADKIALEILSNLR